MNKPVYRDELHRAFQNVELHSAGIDYLTVTSTSGAGKKALVLLWMKRRQQLEVLGDVVKKGGFQGYQGETCGPLFFGRREDSFLLKESSAGAEQLYHQIPWKECNCTRIDLQATVKLEQYFGRVSDVLHQRRAAWFEAKGIEPKPIQDHHDRTGRGNELRIGSRESPRYGRVYDKDKESGDERYRNCWRFEVEYKKMLAPKIVEFLQQEKSLHGAILDALLGQFDDWQIELPVVANGVLVAGSIGRREFATDRSMKWLATQVAPSIERLLATVDRESILEALGLAESPSPDLSPITRAWLETTRQNGPKHTA